MILRCHQLNHFLLKIFLRLIKDYLRSQFFSQVSETDMRELIDFFCEELINSPAGILIGIFFGGIVLLAVPKYILAQVEFFKKIKRIKEGQYSVAVEVVLQNFSIHKKYRAHGERQRYRIIRYYKTAEHERINIVNGFNISAFPGQSIYVITFHDSNENSYPDGVKIKANHKGEQDGT